MRRQRLYLDTLEAKPKRFEIASSYRNSLDSDASYAAILDLMELVRAGAGLPKSYYRKNLYKNVDKLLQRKGLMHLHPGDARSEVLIWVVQFIDAVMVLEITDHAPFKTKPPGVDLLVNHGQTIANFEAESSGKSLQSQFGTQSTQPTKPNAAGDVTIPPVAPHRRSR